jgi:hypothetical protein
MIKGDKLEGFRRLLNLAKRYAAVNIEYAKLTAAEKFTLLAGALAVGVVALVCLSFMLVFLSLACVEGFRCLMPLALAYVCTAAIYLVIAVVVIKLRKPLILNPISRFITSVLFDKKPEDK